MSNILIFNKIELMNLIISIQSPIVQLISGKIRIM
jgi:hypothetical protein